MTGFTFQSLKPQDSLSNELRSVIRDNVLQFYAKGLSTEAEEEGLTALYERLSQEDKLDGESNSIANQKKILERYCKNHGITAYRHYDEEIEKVREQHARIVEVTDRAVADKDDVTLDFEGFVDGVAFEGGKGENYPLTIGSGSFIPGFEEQLIGKKTGEECEVNVTFPAEYHVEELKNKPALFKVTVKEIQRKELPELNDEFASEASDFDTLEEYKNNKDRLVSDRLELTAALSQLLQEEQAEQPDTEEILKEIRSVADVLKNPDVGYEEKGNLIRSVVEQIIYDKESGKMSFDIIIS